MIVAPFLGEFGWEVALWVPWLRWMRNNVYKHDLLVTCQSGHEFLYKDFATEVHAFLPIAVSRRDCQNAWRDGVAIKKAGYVEILRDSGYTQRKDQIVTPHDLQVLWPKDSCPRPTRRTEPKLYFAEDARQDCIVVHARASSQNPERNWNPEDADYVAHECVKLGYKVVCIGTKQDAYHPEGVIDMRGEDLETVCQVLASSRVIVGPSSGPLHLANFCGTPAVWWSKNEKDLARYGRHWNPFELPNRTTHEPTWDPKPEQVLDVLSVLLHKQGAAE